MIKLSVCCCTYNRPEMLGELIASYEMQTYPLKYRELIVLDDAGQYGDLRGDGWQIVSFPRRFASLGEKRNACVSLSSPETDFWIVADDDDIYLPHWLECHAKNFENGARWSIARSAYRSQDNTLTGRWHYQNDSCLMHPAHGFSKDLFWKVGGYPHLAGWEDHRLFEKLLHSGTKHRDALRGYRHPYLIYRRFTKEAHATCVKLEDYRKRTETLPTARLEVGWRRDYLSAIEKWSAAGH